MRPDFAAIQTGQRTYAAIVAEFDRNDLISLTQEYYAEIKGIVSGATDAAIVAIPIDPALKDQNEGEGAWTIGHIIAHLTATAEESAALASALARGADFADDLRLRADVAWETLQTAEQINARLAESQRICLAFLETWPDAPDLARTMTFIPRFGPMNAISRYMLGIFHADMHLDQLREIMRRMREQGKA
ncbi:MAG TPA: DinB family protein [Thermomicrobiales bacterium]